MGILSKNMMKAISSVLLPGDAREIVIDPGNLESGETYEVSIGYVGDDGTVSEWTTFDHTVVGNLSTPPAPAISSASVPSGVRLTVQVPDVIDIVKLVVQREQSGPWPVLTLFSGRVSPGNTIVVTDDEINTSDTLTYSAWVEDTAGKTSPVATTTGTATLVETPEGAQAKADQKNKVFTTQPTPPYNMGDLWDVGGTPRVIRRCITAKGSTGSYDPTDWVDVATKGAQAGVDLYDSTGVGLGDNDVITSKGTSADTSAVAGTPAANIAGWGHPGDSTYIDGGKIYTNSITATQIAAGSITANELAASYIEVGGAAADVNSGTTTISGGKIATNSITATQIAAGTITGTEIAADSIATNHIQAGAITSAEIGANAVTATHIQAGAVTATKINVQDLAAISADLGTITAGSIVVGSTNKLWLNDAADGSLAIGGTVKGSAPFRVTAAGALTATNANITGTVTATSGSFTGTITAASGSVGGWDIGSTTLSKGGLTLNSSTNSIKVTSGSSYIELSPSGLTGYDGVLGTTTISIPTDGSAPTFSSGVIKEATYEIYTSGVIKTSADPAISGGLQINNADIQGYDSSGTQFLHIVYSGANAGDFSVGDYAGGSSGIEYDHSAGQLRLRGDLAIESTPAFPSDTDLICYFNFDGDTLVDNSGHGYGNAYQNVSYDQGISGRCLKFVSLNDGYFQALTPAEADEVLGTGLNKPITVSVWFRSDLETTGESNARIISRDASDYWAIVCAQNQTGNQSVWTYIVGSGVGTVQVPKGTWVHRALTWDTDGTWAVYHNGELVASGTATPVASSRGVTIGHNEEGGPYPGAGDCDFVGLIDEVRVYTRALTAQEIRALYLYPSGPSSTLISGNQITTGRVQTADGSSYLDLDAGTFALGSALSWNGSTLSLAGSVTITGGSGISNLSDAGALATKSTVDLATGDVVNKSADHIAESTTRKWAAESGATVGADWGTNLTNIPYDTIYTNDDAVALGFNPTLSDWSGSWPTGWTVWSYSQYMSKDTTKAVVGPYALKCDCPGGVPVGLLADANISTSNPLPSGTFVAGTVNIYLESVTSGLPGILVRLYTNAGKTTFRDTKVQPTSSTTGIWHRVPFTARVNSGEQIYGIRIYLMGAWGGFSTGYFTGVCYFDCFRLALFDNSVDNTAVSISSDGALSGGGGGQVTITGLGYTGDLDATKGAPSGTNVGSTPATTVETNAANGATFTSSDAGALAYNDTADWASQVDNRPIDQDNLCPKPWVEDGLAGKWNGTVVSVTGQSFTKAIQWNVRNLQYNNGGLPGDTAYTFPIDPAGETFFVEVWADTTDCPYNVNVGVKGTKADGSNSWYGISVPANTGWAKYSGTITFSAGYIKGLPWANQATFDTFGTPRIAGLQIRRVEKGATVGAQAGTNLKTSSGDILSDNDIVTGDALVSAGGLLPNWNLSVAGSDGKPAGLEPVENTSDKSGLAFGDSGRTYIRVSHTSDTSVSYGFPAIPIDDKATYTVTIRHKASTNPGSGLYLRVNELNGPLPQGKTHIGLGVAAVAARSSLKDLVGNGPFPGTTWQEDTYTYTPTPGTKFASFSIYNWKATTVQYDVDAVLVVQVGGYEKGATVGAQAGTNLKDSNNNLLTDAAVITSQGTANNTSNVGSTPATTVESGANKANTGLDTDGTLTTRVTPSMSADTTGGVGLYLGSDKMGYYGATGWGSGSFIASDGTGQVANGNITWTASGDLTIAGNFTSFATITGGTIQTATSGARVKLDGDRNQLQLFDATETELVNLSGTGLTIREGGDITLAVTSSTDRGEVKIGGAGVLSGGYDSASARHYVGIWPQSGIADCALVLGADAIVSPSPADVVQTLCFFAHDASYIHIMDSTVTGRFGRIDMNPTGITLWNLTGPTGDASLQVNTYGIGMDYVDPSVGQYKFFMEGDLCWFKWTPIGTSKGVYPLALYTAGVAITNSTVRPSSISAVCHIASNDSIHLHLEYDASNYTDFSVNSSGNLTIAPSGGISTLHADSAAVAQTFVPTKYWELKNDNTGTGVPADTSLGLRFTQSGQAFPGYAVSVQAYANTLTAYGTSDNFTTEDFIASLGPGGSSFATQVRAPSLLVDDGALLIDEISSAAPTLLSGTQCSMYMKNDYLYIVFRDSGGTYRWRALDLNSPGAYFNLYGSSSSPP